MWFNCLGAVRKAGIRCPHQLVVGGGNRDGGAAAGEAAVAGGVLSTCYVMIPCGFYQFPIENLTNETLS